MLDIFTAVVYSMLDIFTAVVCTRVCNSSVKLAVKLSRGTPRKTADILAAALTWLGRRKVAVNLKNLVS